MKKKLVLLAASLGLVVGMNAQTPIVTGNFISTAGQADLQLSNTIFSYIGSGTPWYGPLLTVGGFNDGTYPLQINADYGPHGGKHISFRTKNDDVATWNSWYEIYHSGNLNKSDVDFTTKNLNVSGLIHTSGCSVTLSEQGTYFGGWNNLTGGTGETDFINHMGGGSGGFAFYNSNNTNIGTLLMFLNGHGNLLIGKTTQENPEYKLDVAGSIRANEIKVNTTGADFVFEPTYKLRSLAEVETFINQHKHLPDVAPAAEMQTNGVSMGEMQAKLLQKVEELTLYSIEQDKAKAKLEVKVEEQSKKNIELEQKLDKQTAELQQKLLDQSKEIEQLKQFITQKLK